MDETKVASTSVEEFYKNSNRTKTIILPSGHIFTLKKITGRDFLKDSMIPLMSIGNLTGNAEERNKIIMERMTAEQKIQVMNMNDSLIVRAVLAPKLSLKEEPESIFIGDISDTDYYFILNEVNLFSKGGEENLKSFRDDSDPANPGRDSKAI